MKKITAILLLASAFAAQSCITVVASEDGTVTTARSLQKKEKELKKREQALAKREAALGTTATAQSLSGLDFGDDASAWGSRTVIRSNDGDEASDKEKKTVTYALDGFDEICVNGVAAVAFTQAADFKVSARGAEKDLAETTVTVEGHTLVVGTKKGAAHRNMDGLTLQVSAPTLGGITVNGVGAFKTTGEVKVKGDFFIHLNGVGAMRFPSLECRHLDIAHQGVGALTMKVKATDITVDKSGVGSADMNVDCHTITVNKGGIGSFKLSGKADRYTRHKGGFGSYNDNGMKTTK